MGRRGLPRSAIAWLGAGLAAWGLALGCASVPEAPPRSLGYESAGGCTPSSGPPGEGARRESARIARGLLEDTFVLLSNEHPDEHRQFILRERAPLQRYPRLTSPVLVDPTGMQPGGERRAPAWLVPLVLDQRQTSEMDAEELAGQLSFWLVPHGGPIDGAPWRDVTECLVREEADAAGVLAPTRDRGRSVGAGDLFRAATLEFRSLGREERLVGLVFEIPTSAADPGEQTGPGFYDLKVLPRMESLRGVDVETAALAGIRSALQVGDWAQALRLARTLTPMAVAGPVAAEDLRRIASRVHLHASPNFEHDLRFLRGALHELADEVEQAPDDRAPRAQAERWASRMELALSRAERAIRSLLEAPNSLAPVALRDPAREPKRCGDRDCIRFAVAGDLQYHGNIGALLRFLSQFDPGIFELGASGPDAGSPIRGGPAVDVDFVVLAGDLADSAAGSELLQLGLNFLAVLPPSSPYGEDGGREMPEIRDQLARFRKPLFAIPGNHDGYAGFGGLLNVAIDEIGTLAQSAIGLADPYRGRRVASAIRSANDYVPHLVAWRLLARQPRYDGLGEFQHYLGPLNIGFRFRGHSFIGLNSFDLTAHERAAVGGVIMHWGGGLQDESVEWFEDAVDRLRPEPGGRQFVVMHNDPRGASPIKSSYREDHFGFYDATDSPISKWTLGHLGIGHSPRTGLYWPIATPLVHYVTRAMEIGWGEDAGDWQEEWMRKRDWSLPGVYDQSVYNGRDLIEIINCNLAGREAEAAPPPEMARARLDRLLPWREESEHCTAPEGAISHLIFAHNDVPYESLWGDPEQRGAIFREPTDRRWGAVFSPGSQVGAMMGFKHRNGSPPKWARRLHLRSANGNAKVLRLDDIGQVDSYHGFHVITLYADGEETIEWMPLAR